MPIERCARPDCGKPTEVLVVLVLTSLTGDQVGEPVTAALCADHAAAVRYLVERTAGN